MKLVINAASDEILQWADSDEGQDAQSDYSEAMYKYLQRSFKNCQIDEDVNDDGKDTWIVSSPESDSEYTYDFDLDLQLERIHDLGANAAAKQDYKDVVDKIRPLLSGKKSIDKFLTWFQGKSEYTFEKFEEYLIDAIAEVYPYPATNTWCDLPEYDLDDKFDIDYYNKHNQTPEDVANQGLCCNVSFYGTITISYTCKYEDIYLMGPKKVASKVSKVLLDMISKDDRLKSVKETSLTSIIDDITQHGGYKNFVEYMFSKDLKAINSDDPYDSYSNRIARCLKKAINKFEFDADNSENDHQSVETYLDTGGSDFLVDLASDVFDMFEQYGFIISNVHRGEQHLDDVIYFDVSY